MNRKYRMVRAMAQEEADFAVFFGGSVVATGWSDVPFAEQPSEEAAVEAVRARYYAGSATPPQVVGRKLNEVKLFMQITPGDLIVVPWRSNIAMAVATGRRRYDRSGGRARDLANQHEVSYLQEDGSVRAIPRVTLPHRLQRRLRVPGSAVMDLAEFGEDLERLLRGESAQSAYEDAVAAAKEQAIDEVRRRLESGRGTTLRAGGLGLEELVRQLLVAEGYEATRLDKRTFADHADADIIAVREDPIRPVKRLVQVKHHEGLSGSWGADQLAAIRAGGRHADYDLVLVTSAGASADLQRICRANGIILLDGEALANWVYDRCASLTGEMQRELGLSIGPLLHQFAGPHLVT